MAGVTQTQSGYEGTNASGKTTSFAPLAAASASVSQAFLDRRRPVHEDGRDLGSGDGEPLGFRHHSPPGTG
jgi:hypothetical protein